MDGRTKVIDGYELIGFITIAMSSDESEGNRVASNILFVD